MSDHPFALRWRWLRALAALVVALTSLLQTVLLAHVKLFNIQVVMPHSHFSNIVTMRNSSMNKRLYKVFSLIMILTLMLLALPVQSAQAVSLTTLGTPITQNFDTLATSGATNTWTDDSTLLGLYAQFSLQPTNPTIYIANAGSTSNGAIYSFGTGTSTERAFGSVASGTPGNIFYALKLTNNTGSTITSLDIDYIGEQWRNGGNTSAQQLDFQYQVASPGTITDANAPSTGWTDFNTLDFVSPTVGATAVALDGNTAANQTAKSANLPVTVSGGQEIWLRWMDTNDAGNDHGLAIDDFSVTANGGSETPNLSVNDVTQAETNSGTTTFTFTVSLSAPAGAGGVTFDIATADGTAQDDNPATEDNDYVVQSLTGQTIPMGSSGPYNFNVTVNGDINPEPSETFFVNITNVIGATVADGQGLGTIVNDEMAVLVINEIDYDQAGTDTAEFIEIKNVSASAVDLDSYELLVVNGNGGGAAIATTINLPSFNLAAGDYYVVCANTATMNNCDLDVTPNTDLIQNGAPDAVALVQGSAVIDTVSYEGNTGAPYTEGSGSGLIDDGTNANQGISRLPDGVDTNQNNVDFSLRCITPGEANTTSTSGCILDLRPSVISTNPGNGATDVSISSNIDINFSEAVTASGNWFTITCGTSGGHTASVSGGPQNYALDPDVDFAFSELCTVTVLAANIADQDGTPDNMSGNYSFSFTTAGQPFGACGDPATFIHDIQGTGATSPFNNATGISIEGVVVGDYQDAGQLGGYYVQEQDADADADPATSEGIFVFNTAFPVNVGDKVRVKGTVTEFTTSGVFLTELTNVSSLTVCSSGNTVTASNVTLPVASLADWERYEGMLINIVQDLTATETFTLGRFGEVSLSVNGRLHNPTNITTPGPLAIAQQDLNNRSRILLDDGNGQQNIDPTIHPIGGLDATNTLRSGYTVHGLTGVLEQRFGVYRVQPVGSVSFDSSTNLRTAAPDPVGGTLKVAALNVLNFFTTLDTAPGLCGPTGGLDCRGANSAFEFDRQRVKIINSIIAINPDIAGLMEVQNDSTATIQNLVDGLNDAAGAGTYAFINTGTIGTDAIKVAIIYKPAVVTPAGAFAILNTSVNPLFIDTKNRPTLAQTFMRNADGAKLTVVVNHLKSKGSDCNDLGDPDTGDGQGNCNVTRTNAATALVSWLVSDPTGSGDPDFLVVGDMNSYAKEDPITTIKNGGYTNLLETLIGADAYSYVFDGQSGYLDHALASSSLASQVTGVTEWHNNADEPVVLDYNVEFKTANQVNTFYTSDPYRASDHDPVVVGLNLTETIPPNTTIDSSPSNPTNSSSASFTFSGTDNVTTPGNLTFECKLDGGSFGPCTSPQNYSSLADGSHTFQVRAIDGAGNTDPTPASFTWTIDTIAPTTTINSNPSNPTNSTSASFSFSGTDAGTGVASFECQLDGGGFATCTSPQSYSSLADGSHTFQVRAIDGAGNVDPTPASFTWTIDTIAPTISVAAGGVCASSGGTMNLTVADSSGNPLTLSGISSNTTAVPSIAFGGSGSSRTVTSTAVPVSTVRTAVVTITVSDGVNTASTTITVIVGTSGNNTSLNGTSGADLILGLAGNDILSGLAGNDLLCGGSSNDTINGGDNDDTLDGEIGNDILNGGAGNDGLFGSNGNDSLTGGTGTDNFDGGPGNDIATDYDASQDGTKVNIP
jgi:uncharacterized protein